MSKRQRKAERRPDLIRGKNGAMTDPGVLYDFAQWILQDDRNSPDLPYPVYPRTVQQFVQDLAFPYHPLTPVEESFLRALVSAVGHGYDVRKLLRIKPRKVGHKEADPWAVRVAAEVDRMIDADPDAHGATERAIEKVRELSGESYDTVKKIHQRDRKRRSKE